MSGLLSELQYKEETVEATLAQLSQEKMTLREENAGVLAENERFGKMMRRFGTSHEGCRDGGPRGRGCIAEALHWRGRRRSLR